MLLFSSGEHVDRWCRDWNLARGGSLSVEQTWQLALIWYGGDRRDPRWRRRSVEEAQDVLSDIGLEGPFWRLD